MKTLEFKTTINCGGCVTKVTPILNTMVGIKKWKIDINDPNKILLVETDSLNGEEIITKLKSTGFSAEIVNRNLY